MSTARKIYRSQNSGDNEISNKVSNHIQTQLPEFIQADHPVFSKFVKLYYQFLESAELVFLETNNYLREETDTTNFILDENGDNIVLEDSEVKYIVGETLKGQTSGATAKVLVDDVDDNKRLFVSSQTQFIIGEKIIGLTSNSSGTLQSYKPNPVSSIQQLLSYANVDSTIFTFLDKFRDSFLEGIVDNLADGVNKRKLIKNIRDLYIAKGTRKGHELFFRLLLNEEATITYPNEQMLRLSDGKWTTRNIIRAKPLDGDVSELIGTTITGRISGATAIIVSTVSFIEDNKDVVQLELDKSTKDGDFIKNEIVVGISSTTGRTIRFQPYDIVVSIPVTNSGSYYSPDEKVNVSTGTAAAKVQTINSGSIDEVVVDDAGTGYKVGENLLVDNSGTNGTGFSAQVSVVGGGIQIESGSISEYGMSIDDHITMEEASQTFYQDSYEGTKIVLETATHGDAPGSQASEASEITDIRIISGGFGYTKLPILDKTNKYNILGSLDDTGQVYSTGVLSSGGSGAKLLPVTNTGMGGVNSFQITNQGVDYNTPPKLDPISHLILKDITGTFSAKDIVTTVSRVKLESEDGEIELETATGSGNIVTEDHPYNATVLSFDTERQLISISTTATNLDLKYSVGNLITSNSGATGVIANVDIAVGDAQLGTSTETSGEFINSNGLLSDKLQRIQDSFYYQDYSYVVRVGESINTWRDVIKSTVHPAGWNVFGEVEVIGRADAKISVQTIESFSPEFASVLRGVFTTIFGRRLGTKDDGTSVKANAKIGTNELSDLSSTTRDVTLTTNRNVTIGFARAPRKSGSTLDLLARYAFAVPPTPDNNEVANYPNFRRTAKDNHDNNAYFTIEQFSNFKIEEVSIETKKDTYDDTNIKFDTGNVKFDNGAVSGIPETAFNTSINVPPPGQIIISKGAVSYDETATKFDTSLVKFDVG